MGKGLRCYKELTRALSDEEVLCFIDREDEWGISKLLSSQSLSIVCLDRLLYDKKWVYNHLVSYKIMTSQILSEYQIDILLNARKSNIRDLIVSQDLTKFIENQSDKLLYLISKGNGSGLRKLLASNLIDYQNPPLSFINALKEKCMIRNIPGSEPLIDISGFERCSNNSTLAYLEGSREYRIDRIPNVSGCMLNSEILDLTKDYLEIELQIPHGCTERMIRMRPIDKFTRRSYVKNGKRLKLL